MPTEQLNGCLTAQWQMLTLSLWTITLLFIGLQIHALVHAAATRRSLEATGITGEAYERLKPNSAKHWRRLVVWTALSFAILIGYTSFFSSFECSKDSILYIAPHIDS